MARHGPAQKEHRCTMTVYDHIGNKYESRRDMLAHYGITPTDLHRGLKKGMTLDVILSGGTVNKQRVTDHKGVEYPTETELLKHYGISRYLYHKRLSNGYTQQQSLEMRHAVKPKPKKKVITDEHIRDQ